MLIDAFMAFDPVAWGIDLHAFPVFQLGVVFLGYLVLGVTGFGSALIIIPLLVWQWPLTLVVPLVLMTDIPTSILHTGLNFREVAWRELPRLLPAVVVGALSGAVLIQVTSGHGLLAVLGLYVTWIGVRGLKASEPFVHATGRLAQNTAGFSMGLIETMFGTAGPVVLMWLSRRLENPHALRATMPITILVLSSMALVSVALAGNLNQPEIWHSVVILMPSAFLGVWCGHRLAMLVNPQTLKPIIFGLLGLSGVVLTLRAVMLVISE